MGFLQNLLPQEKIFNDGLIQLATLSLDCCNNLKTLLSEIEPNSKTQQALFDHKTKAKQLLEDYTVALCRSFITPYDREDMQSLAVTLYKIPKRANKIKSKLAIDCGVKHRGDFLKLIDIVLQQANLLVDMIEQFNKHSMMRVHDASMQIHQLEDEQDALVAELTQQLAANCPDVKEFIIVKDIYDMLEKLADNYRDASDLGMRIILKHS